MTRNISPDRDLIAPLVEEPSRSGLFVDYDGTLAPIVPNPKDAIPLDGVPSLLRDLSRRLAVLAIVSGRRAQELVGWLGPEIEVWGLHGLERSVDGSVSLAEDAAPYAPVIDRARRAAELALDDVFIEGVTLEDKDVILALHYRNSANHEAAAEQVAELARTLADDHGLRATAARLVWEVRPPLDVSKATVVLNRSREQKARSAAFIGDDAVDLPAFDALDELEAEGVRVLRVAVRSDEAPAELLQRADLTIDGPAGVVAFLEAVSAESAGKMRR